MKVIFNLLLVAVAMMFGHSNGTIPSLASIITIPANTAPSPPPGLKNPYGSQDRPGVKLGSLTLHEYSYIDNRMSMQIIAYDEEGNIVTQWQKTGARYMTSISLGDDGSIIFTGQSDKSVSLTCSDLRPLMFQGIVSIVTVSKAEVPKPPSNMNLMPMGFPFLLYGSGPMLQAGRLQIYEYAYRDNRMTMALVAYDENGNKVKSWDKTGARYMSTMSEDAANYAVVLTGQSDKKTTLTWDDLCPSSPPSGVILARGGNGKHKLLYATIGSIGSVLVTGAVVIGALACRKKSTPSSRYEMVNDA